MGFYYNELKGIDHMYIIHMYQYIVSMVAVILHSYF